MRDILNPLLRRFCYSEKNKMAKLMSETPARNFNLRWHTHDEYRICLMAAHHGEIASPLVIALSNIGMRPESHNLLCMKTPRDWKTSWGRIYKVLEEMHALDLLDASVTPVQDVADTAERKPVSVVQMIAESLWLGNALMEDRVVCYLQTVVNARGQVFGYESFARVRSADGSIIGGERIMAASRALGLEYMIDRHLHVQAIKTFVSSSFNGFLFVNLFPGFIHRPEVYLEGVSETAKRLGIVAKHIVLDVTRAESPHDFKHLKAVCEYARSRGMSVALDDIESLGGAQKLVPEIRPDFVKLDSKLTRKIAEDGRRDIIRMIVELTHESGGSVIAEGVETQEVYDQLVSLSVDLFQGYLFSAPMPVEAALHKAIGRFTLRIYSPQMVDFC